MIKIFTSLRITVSFMLIALSLPLEFYFEGYTKDFHWKKKEVTRSFFKFDHNFISWHCSATCCQDNTAEAHWFGIWGFSTSSILSWSLTHRLSFFPAPWHLSMPKIFRSKGEVETALKDFLASMPLELYCTGINNLVNRLQECIDVQRSYFD